jgi:hypothetical protein
LINASDANQGVAVTSSYLFSIDNYSITKHHRANGSAISQWYGGPSGSIIHLDGGVVINDTLYAPHSNYPSSPITSSIETWDIDSMNHTFSYSFGIYRGSLTWLDQNPMTGEWYGAFANYDRVQSGQMTPYGLTMNTQLVQFSGPPSWTVERSWIFPDALLESFSPMSNSGGSFGPDGWLYVTGHDASEAYVLKIPEAGSVVIWVATVSLPEIAGQGIAWDRSQKGVVNGTGVLYGISRESRQIVEMRVPLQVDCAWETTLEVGRVLEVGQVAMPDD